jgi:hypothetical protein
MAAYQIPASQSIANPPSSSSAELGPKLFNRKPASGPVQRPDYDNQKDANSRPAEQFRSSSGYSIWQQPSYLGSYQIPASLLSANLPSCPFPGMGPKLFNRKNPLPPHDNPN